MALSMSLTGSQPSFRRFFDKYKRAPSVFSARDCPGPRPVKPKVLSQP